MSFDYITRAKTVPYGLACHAQPAMTRELLSLISTGRGREATSQLLQSGHQQLFILRSGFAPGQGEVL